MLAKLLLDENMSVSVAGTLCTEGIDACHVRDRNMLGVKDQGVLDRALEEDRILVTANVDDFVRLARKRELHAAPVTPGFNAPVSSARPPAPSTLEIATGNGGYMRTEWKGVLRGDGSLMFEPWRNVHNRPRDCDDPWQNEANRPQDRKLDDARCQIGPLAKQWCRVPPEDLAYLWETAAEVA